VAPEKGDRVRVAESPAHGSSSAGTKRRRPSCRDPPHASRPQMPTASAPPPAPTRRCGVHQYSAKPATWALSEAPPSDGAVKVNAFKLRSTTPERVQVDHASQLNRETECQVPDSAEFWNPPGWSVVEHAAGRC